MRKDKSQVLSFCANTFSWGDYIDQVWDIWLRDPRGLMLVAELDGRQVGLSRVATCPDSRSIWLEGVRVHPSHRRSRIATALIKEMLEFGRERRASRALAIVAGDNTASQRMMERSGFSAISEWSYYSTANAPAKEDSAARIASADDLDPIVKYLDRSRIYRRSAQMYVRTWHWYSLNRATIAELVREHRIVVAGKPICGVSVINSAGYWKRRNVMQIVYLDSQRNKELRDLVAFAGNIRLGGRHEHLQVMCAHDKKIDSLMQKLRIQESERFTLYSKDLTG